jgi:rod shape-determining protein MreC
MSPIIKRKGEKFTLPSKYLLFILTILCSAMMLLTFGTDIFNKPLNTVVGYVVIPFQEGISKVGGWLAKRSKELIEIRSLLAENEALRDEVAQLTDDNIQLQQDWYELNNLRSLLSLEQEYKEYDMVGARVIANDSGNWFSTFEIDKGAEDGLTIDMNVLAVGGLVGRITTVGPNWARVTSIISDNSNVGGQTSATADRMMVNGDLKLMAQGLIRFSRLIDSDDQVRIGHKVVTSDISDKYLPGILIGYVNYIEQDSNNLTKSGYLAPAVDFEHLSEVLVILELKQQVDESTAIESDTDVPEETEENQTEESMSIDESS